MNKPQIVLADQENPQPIMTGMMFHLVEDGYQTPVTLVQMVAKEDGSVWGLFAISGARGHNWYRLSGPGCASAMGL